MPQLDESVAAHLCPTSAIGWKAKANHLSKPCRTTSALAGRSYASAGQAASALHSMAVLQVYQAKLLSAVDESEPDPATLRELRSATDLALRATKTTAQAIGRSMASLVVLGRHLWLTLTEIKDADRVSFLDAPISPSGLFGPAVKGFAERFTEAQKASQAMRHFLPKRSSPAAAQSRPRTVLTQQPAKPAPAVFAPQPARTQQPRGRSRSARSGYVISEQCPLRGVDAPSVGGSEDLEDLWQGRSRPFRLQRQLSLPNLLFEGQGRIGPRLAQPPPLCIPPDRPASTGRQAYQGTGSQGAIGGPIVEEPTLVVRADSATDSSPLARAPETGSPLSGERNNMAPSTRAVGSLHLAAQWEPTGLPERVLNTISEARAPSTRRLYALKWSVFSTWCLNRGENPSTSELAVVLSFLQELLDKGRSHSTLKVFVEAIAAFHAPIAGQSVGRDNSVVRFLKGARRLNPPLPLTCPYMGSAHCTEGLERPSL